MERRVDWEFAGSSPTRPTHAPEPTVFVVVQDSARRGLLTSQLISMKFPTEFYGSGDDYHRAFNADRCGCLVVDSRSATDGLELRRRLPAPVVPQMILIADDSDVTTVVRVMKAGASDFLPRRSYTETELWEAIQRSLALDAEARAVHALQCRRNTLLASLTQVERDVLRLLLQGPNNAQIATKLGITEAAVEGRRTRLMKKLEVTNLPSLIRFVLEGGFETEL